MATSPIIKKHRIRGNGPEGPHGAGTTAGACVRLHREDELVSAIEVVCTCGRRMMLDCVYGEDGTGDAPEPGRGEPAEGDPS